MRFLFFFGSLALCSVACGTVTLDVTENGAPAGSVVWSVRLGGKELTERLSILPGGKQAAKNVVAYLDADGSPKRIEFDTVTTTLSNGRLSRGRTSVTASFPSGKDAEAVLHLGGRTIKQPIAAPPLPTANPSAFWFVRDQPKPDTTVEFASYDILNLRWEQVDRTYVGRRKVPGQDFIGEANLIHEVRDGVESNLYLDEKGEPILIEKGATRMVRR